MRVTVVGMGKIGLPLAVQFASKGHTVIGVDINEATVKQINSSIEPFPGENNLSERLSQAIEMNAFTATADISAAVSVSEVIVIVVPLIVDDAGNPDFKALDSVTLSVAQALKRGALVSYETTLPVGTTRERFAPMLEKGSGLKSELDFFVSFSPERVLTGRVFADLRKYPKLIGGIGPESAKIARLFYESALDFDERVDLSRPNGVWDLGTSEASELAKLAETTYRDVNIALANQFAKYASLNKIDIYSVIEACNSQHYSHIHQPGIAVGGHCIPIYPQMYLWSDPTASLVAEARSVNQSMPRYAVQRLCKHLGNLKDKKIVILGASYRGGVKEVAFSGVFPLVQELESMGAVAVVHDPLYSETELLNLGLKPYTFGQSVDAAVLQANHIEYLSLKAGDLPGAEVILDGRNFLPPRFADKEIPTIVLGK